MSGQEMSRLVVILADGIRVLVKRGDAALTEDQIFERARNQAQAVMGAYFMVPHPGSAEDLFPKVAELRELYAMGKPQGHGHSCACRDCKVFNQARRMS